MGQSLRKKVRMLIGILLIGLLLVSCGSTTTNATPTDYKYKVTVNLKDDVTKAEIEEAFDGKVVGWYPASALATVETNMDVNATSIAQQGELLELYKVANAFFSGTTTKARAVTPVSQNGSSAWASGSSAWASGSSAWASGSSAWASGSSAWASGSSAWASGSSAWASGVLGGYFKDNKTTFENINLFETHANTKNFGEDIIVAVIDSGLDLNHPMFIDRLDSQNYWKDFIDDDNYPQDSANINDVGYGHGTAVAGVILQVAPRIKLMPIRVIGPDGTGDTDDIAAAIEHAVLSGADIINLSLGTDVTDGAIEAMLAVAQNAGVLTVASAGNTGEESLLFPANVANNLTLDLETVDQTRTQEANFVNNILKDKGFGKTNVLGISSVNTSDKLSIFSSFGPSMDLVAPGESIVTAYPNSKFVAASGTSFSAPIVAGALALALAESNRYVEQNLLLDLIKVTADDVSSDNESQVLNITGKISRLDIYNFMALTMGWNANTPTEPVQQPTQVATESTIYANYFNNGNDQFYYLDEVFSNNGNSNFEEGIVHGNNTLCKSNNSCLEVKVGGIDNSKKYGLSGGYTFDFNLDQAQQINLNVQLRTIHASKYESDEYVETRISVDGDFIGENGEGYITKLVGGGVSTTDSDWVNVSKSLGVLSAGEHTITIGIFVNKKTYNNEISSLYIDDFKLTRITPIGTDSIPEPEPEQTYAYGGTPITLPGKIEVENFDTDGKNNAYFDSDNGNNGNHSATHCRVNQDVDTIALDNNNCKVGWTKQGEWLKYTINVTQSGTYNVYASASSKGSGGTFELEIDGTVVSSAQVSNTGNWNSFKEVSMPSIQLTQGVHSLKLNMVSEGDSGYIGDFDYLRFALK